MAYEMASQLVDANLQVEFLGLLDTSHLSTDVKIKNSMGSACKIDVDYVIRNFIEAGLGKKVDSSKKINELSDLVDMYQEMDFLSDFMGESELMDYAMRVSHHINASIAYYAKSIPMRVHIFEASQSSRNNPFLGSPVQSWQGVLPEDLIRVIKVPGTHQTMMESPNVEFLSRVLSEAMKSGLTDPLS